MKKSIAVLIGLGICASSFASGNNMQLAPTVISNPRDIRPNSRDSIYLNIKALPRAAFYDIECALSAQQDSRGVYAGFLTRNIGRGAALMFNGVKVVVNQTVIVPEGKAALIAKNVTIALDQVIIIENRDSKSSLTVGACLATPVVSGK